MNITTRLKMMSFMQYFIWGSWLVTLGAYMINTLHFTGSDVGMVYSSKGLAAIVMPSLVGIIADKWLRADRAYVICHLVCAVALCYAAAGFTSLRLREASFLVAMPEDHRLVREPSIALAELQDEYFVTMPSAHSDWAFLHRVCQQAGFSPMIVREAVEPQTVLAMISMGMGITLAADSYAQMQWPGVVFRPLKERIPADLYVVYDEKQATPAVKTLITTLTAGK